MTWLDWTRLAAGYGLFTLAVALIAWTVVVRLQDERRLQARHDAHVQRLLAMLTYIRSLLAVRNLRA